VQGAFADASSYAAVILELSADGLRVVAPAVPNRSLIGDAAQSAASIAAQGPWPRPSGSTGETANEGTEGGDGLMSAEAGSPISTYFRVCDGVRVRFADTRAESDTTVLALAPWPESLWAFRRIWDRGSASGGWSPSTCRGSATPTAART
jgi:hypothetical protein